MASFGDDARQRFLEEHIRTSPSAEAERAARTPEPKRLPSLCELFCKRSAQQCCLLAVGLLAGLVAGTTLPAFTWFFGDIIAGVFNPDKEVRTTKTLRGMYVFLCISAVSFAANFVMMWCFATSAAKQVRELRRKVFAHLLIQDMTWFDLQDRSSLTTQLLSDTADFRAGTGEKLSYLVTAVSQCVMGFAVAFTRNTELALVMAAAVPMMGGGIGLAMYVISRREAVMQDIYATAGGLAETVLSAIRTVTAFGGQSHELAKYEHQLNYARQRANSSGAILGFSLGTSRLIIFAFVALGFWYGGRMIVSDVNSGCIQWFAPPSSMFDRCFTGGQMLSCMFAVMIGGAGVGRAAPAMASLGRARGAAGRLWQVLASTPNIKLSSGQILPDVEGVIELDSVLFAYPARHTVPALKNVSIRLQPCATTALVGPSGSGKSTIVSLLLRFYDPQAGTIRVDGHDICSLDVTWLRAQMALVQQEPVLFSGSICDNILYGRLEATKDQVESAAKLANAHEFITKLPDGYDTQVGERGGQMSGGQKQRIAIARAVIRDPAILLLDEATSALDAESERVVQAALDDLLRRRKRTTIIIAHRLSTIRTADEIIVLQDGLLVERGTHADLISRTGSLYAQLVQLQTVSSDESQSGCAEEMANRIQIKTRYLQAEAHEVTSEDQQTGNIANHSSHSQAVEQQVPVRRLWSLSKRDIGFLILALLGSVGVGASQPLMGHLFGDDTQTFADPRNLFHTKLLQDSAEHLAVMQLSIGAGTFLCTFLAQWAIRVMSESLSYKLRGLCFKSMLRQEIDWFDHQTTGLLTSRLATEVPLVAAFTGESLAQYFEIIACALTGVVLALNQSVLMTAVVFGIVPFLGGAQSLALRNITGKSGVTTGTGELLQECLANIQTVCAYGLQAKFQSRYLGLLDVETKQEKKEAVTTAFGVALMSAMFGIFPAIVFGSGCAFMNKGWVEPSAVTGVLFPLIFCSTGLGAAFLHVKDKKAGKLAAHSIFTTIDRPSAINPDLTQGGKLDKIEGSITFEKVHFSYSLRAQTMIFSDFSLSIPARTTVALVGPSGSGKSTVVSLLLRFYDPQSGTILLDCHDLRSLDVAWLRSQMALVQQEPVLFSGSVCNNILYGRLGANREEVEAAAKLANAHEFISKLPEGYETQVGERGGQMSGGQKQRIAIARAVIRDPAILLLDEATSALDSESERVVQVALDDLASRKTCTTIVIAHRLSTVQAADKICVVYQGQIVEQGSHTELLAISGGHYAALVRRQLCK